MKKAIIGAALALLLMGAGGAARQRRRSRLDERALGDRAKAGAGPRRAGRRRAAGVMLGYSRSGSGEAVREFEFLRLQAGADGVPVYLAQPGGRPPVALPADRARRHQRDLRKSGP